MAKHIMAIGAHILDAEISCGMTLAKHSMLGDKVTTVALTAGENGHPKEFTKEEFRQVNIKGAEDFAAELGGQFICLNYSDSQVPETEELYNTLADLIRKEKPDIILTHWGGSGHEDHNLAPKAVSKAVRRAGYSESENYPPHRVSKVYYAENWEDMRGFIPYLYVDVTAAFDLWSRAIQKVYFAKNATYFRYYEYYEALSRVRGELARIQIPGCERAECFAISEHDRFNTVLRQDSL